MRLWLGLCLPLLKKYKNILALVIIFGELSMIDEEISIRKINKLTGWCYTDAC
jgi:hypothetical protein